MVEDGVVGGKVDARVRAGVLVAASGGLEANIDWLKELGRHR